MGFTDYVEDYGIINEEQKKEEELETLKAFKKGVETGINVREFIDSMIELLKEIGIIVLIFSAIKWVKRH